jgi:hypothetical protein
MPHAINGPHIFIGAHMGALREVFTRLRDACETHGGTLSRAELEAALAAIEAHADAEFGRFEAAFEACMRAHERSPGRHFDAAAGARFALFAACQYAIDEAFSNQRARAPREWAMVVCDALIELGEGSFAPNYRQMIWKAYQTLAFRTGAKLDAVSFAAAPEIRTVARAFIGGFLNEIDAHEDMAWLVHPLNVAISRKFKIAAPHVLLVNGHQMKTFGTRLWDDLAARLA